MTLTTPSWQQKYESAVAGLGELVNQAPRVAAGFSVCNDHVVEVAVEEYAQIAAAVASADPEQRGLARWLLQRIKDGRGGEIVTGPGGFSWIESTFYGPPSMGGTGAQVARVLAAIGAPQVVALTDRTSTQLDTLDERLLLVGADGELHAPNEIYRTTERPNDPIFVLQFTQGVLLADNVVTRRSTRIIIRAQDRPLDLDEHFARYVRCNHVPALLLSGFQTALPSSVGPIRQWFSEHVHLTSADRLVHLELAEYESVEHVLDTIAQFAGFANSIGMSLSELSQLTPNTEPVTAALELANRFGFDRVSVHADDFAFVVSSGDPVIEQQALLTGCLLAAARAVVGVPVLPTEIPAGTTVGDVPPNIELASGDERYTVVSVPSPYTPTPTATLGLGDTFVAGMMLALASHLTTSNSV
jgi:ADP-dependent phosphofructokinase/glucokinase